MLLGGTGEDYFTIFTTNLHNEELTNKYRIEVKSGTETQ
jgi:hypothetical protein